MLDRIFNKTTMELIDLLALNPTHIRDIAEKLNASPGHIHHIIQFLKKNELILEKREKNRKIICINSKNTLIKKIRSLINMGKLLETKSFNRLRELGPIGIYGSFAQGTNDKDSDLDVWVYTDKKLISFQNVLRELENDLSIRANLLILNRNKISELKKEDREFYIRLKLTSILFGEDIFD